MCGLSGIWARGRYANEVGQWAGRMAETLTHRGPDDQGVWVDPSGEVALSFRRLSIIDLSALGHQPMSSASGRYTMVFNGEVYNFAELRRELEARGARFRGHSDTEVMLAAFEAWGVAQATTRFVGMFAVAVWDAETRALTLLRDRLGIKPLFVFARAGMVAFASELKALLTVPGFDRTLDLNAVTAYLRYLYIPAPQSVFSAVRKLLPGHTLTITSPEAPLPEPTPYWSAEAAARAGAANPFSGSADEAIAELDQLLTAAVRLRLVADVPLGAFLSGGIDSSTVVALMQRASSRPVKTFTIGFDDPEHNEAPQAAAVARHLGTDHTELMVRGADALALVPQLPGMFDEPLADPSAIPTYLVSALARRDVIVALSGDGGDEVFGGYNRYRTAATLLPRLAALPRPARRALGMVARAVPSGAAKMAGRALRLRLVDDRLRKIGHLTQHDSLPAMYRSVIAASQEPARWVPGASDRVSRMDQIIEGDARANVIERMMLGDQVTYLADDLLAKVDRASMAVSLEARVPLLDHRVVEFAWRLPLNWKLNGTTSKWMLREVLARLVPRHLVERPKVGFTAPIEQWLRGPLREWAADLLAPAAIKRVGVLASDTAAAQWRDFDAGRGNALEVWTAASFQAWAARWVT